MTVARTSVGTFVSSAAALTVLPGAGSTAGDFGLIIVETANQAATTPTGWTAAGSIGVGTAGAAGATLLSLFVKASIVSADISTGVSIADSGDHQGAQFLTYSGVVSYVSSTGKTQSSASTAASTNALALTSYLTTNDIALAIFGTDRDSATVSTNASAAWSGVAGSNSFPVNVSTATGAGGGIIVNELVPSGNATSAASFSCTVTSTIWNSFLLVLQGSNGNANASTLTDNFDDNSLDGTKWNTGPLFNGKSAGTCVVAETGGHTEVTPSGTANEYSGRNSVNTYNFDNSYVGVTAAGGEAATQETYLSAGADGNNCYMALWSNNNSTFCIRKYTGGTNTDRGQVTVGGGSVGSLRWRLRWGQLADDTIYLESAPLTADPPVSGDWTVRDSVARDATISLIAAKVGFGGGCWSAAGSPQLIQFDGFNTATTSGAITLSGQSVASALGSQSPSTSMSLSGGAVAAAQGSTAPQIARGLTGQTLSIASGSVTQQTTVALTGQSLSAAQGQILQGAPLVGQIVAAARGSLTGAVTIALTGQSVSVARGVVTAAPSIALAGQSIAAAPGSVVASPSLALTGQAAAVSRGTLLASTSLPLTGQSANIAQGAVVVAGSSDVTAALTGQAISASQGTIAGSRSLTLAGQATSAATGTISLTISPALSGQAAAAQSGSLSVGSSIALTGSGIVMSRGTVAPAFGATLAGKSLIAGQGTASPSSTLAALGIGLVVNRGTVVPASNDVVVALTGIAAILAQSSLTPQFIAGLVGSGLTVAPGTVVGGLHLQYPLADIPQHRPNEAANEGYPLTGTQGRPLTVSQSRPLEGVAQHYPLENAA